MAFNLLSTTNPLLQKLGTVFVLGAAFFISAGTVLYFSFKGKEVKVPDLVGKPENEAEKLLSDQGLRFKIRNRTTDEKIQANLISEQLPGAGVTVKVGQIVGVTVSTGIEAKKEEVKVAPKPVAPPKPKPKPSTSPKNKEKATEPAESKTPAGEKNKPVAHPVVPKDEEHQVPPASKPTVKPTPKKAENN